MAGLKLSPGCNCSCPGDTECGSCVVKLVSFQGLILRLSGFQDCPRPGVGADDCTGWQLSGLNGRYFIDTTLNTPPADTDTTITITRLLADGSDTTEDFNLNLTLDSSGNYSWTITNPDDTSFGTVTKSGTGSETTIVSVDGKCDDTNGCSVVDGWFIKSEAFVSNAFFPDCIWEEQSSSCTGSCLCPIEEEPQPGFYVTISGYEDCTPADASPNTNGCRGYLYSLMNGTYRYNACIGFANYDIDVPEVEWDGSVSMTGNLWEIDLSLSSGTWTFVIKHYLNSLTQYSVSESGSGDDSGTINLTKYICSQNEPPDTPVCPDGLQTISWSVTHDTTQPTLGDERTLDCIL